MEPACHSCGFGGQVCLPGVLRGQVPTLGLISVLGISNLGFPGLAEGPLDRGLHSSVQEHRTKPLTLSIPHGEAEGHGLPGAMRTLLGLAASLPRPHRQPGQLPSGGCQVEEAAVLRLRLRTLPDLPSLAPGTPIPTP